MLNAEDKPNNLLRYQRLLRGWSLKQVVDQLCQLCVEDEDTPRYHCRYGW